MNARPVRADRARPRFARQGIVVALLVGLTALVTATPAFAHTELVSSNPTSGATLATAPSSISLTFAEAVTVGANPITITGPGGAKWTVGKPSITDATVTAPVQAAGPAGAYTIAWQVIADDGDAVRGTIPFTLTAGPPPTTSAAPTTTATTSAAPASTSSAATTSAAPAVAEAPAPPASGGVPVWVWILIAVVVVLAIAGFAVARSRRSSGDV